MQLIDFLYKLLMFIRMRLRSVTVGYGLPVTVISYINQRGYGGYGSMARAYAELYMHQRERYRFPAYV